MFNSFKKVTSYTIQATRLKGFSLIELLVVIAIIGILAAGGGVYYTQAQKQSRDLRRQSDLAAIQSALELYYSDVKDYPTNLQGLQKLVDDSYITSLPKDPATKTDYLYKAPTKIVGDACESLYLLYATPDLSKNATLPVPDCHPAGSGYIILTGGK